MGANSTGLLKNTLPITNRRKLYTPSVANSNRNSFHSLFRLNRNWKQRIRTKNSKPVSFVSSDKRESPEVKNRCFKEMFSFILTNNASMPKKKKSSLWEAAIYETDSTLIG